MLILTRKIGESIRIGDHVTVRVLSLSGGQVSLGFTAPSEVRIFREELIQADPSEDAPPLVVAPRKVRADASAGRNGSGRRA